VTPAHGAPGSRPPIPGRCFEPTRFEPYAIRTSQHCNDAMRGCPMSEGPVFDLHRGGKLAVAATVPLSTRDDLSLAYTPGVAEVCSAIAADESLVDTFTWVGHTVAVVTDGSAVLGLGNIGPRAAMPVMEGKAVLFKQFGGVDAVPICLDTQDVEEIIAVTTAL